MENLKKKIKEYFINPDVLEAIDRYCAICKQGFRTKGARNAHVTLSHKRGNNTLPEQNPAS